VTRIEIPTPLPDRYERSGPLPEDALARLMAMRGALGITRIADITGLDRIGVPVVQVVRPFSLSNAVSQGKGGTMTQAAISAILEAAEAYFAERVDRFESVVASASSLSIAAGRFARHLRDGAPPDWHDQEIAWVEATNLMDGSRSMVPLELVHTAYTVPPQPYDGIFAASTTGLAASFVETDAIAHGILECVERDAVARANRIHGFFQRNRIDPATIDDAAVCEFLETLSAKGLIVGLWQAPSPIGIATICCHLMEDVEGQEALLPHPAIGSAASLDPAAAIAHAILEAAQSRLAAISGARDDMTRAVYPKYPDWQMIAAHRRLIAEGPRTQSFLKLSKPETEGVKDGLPPLLALLESSHIRDVNLIRLETEPLTGLSVVRIVIPALQPLLES